MPTAAERTDQWISRQGIAPLSAEERQVSARLSELIGAEIAAAGGRIPFRRFMEMALYTPTLGYYTGGKRKFGNSGDFVTAPEISPLFGRCLARQVGDVLKQLGGGSILEFGAGSGKLAVELIQQLERDGQPPERYLIMEVSPDLRLAQQALVAEQLPHYRERVEWLEQLPSGLRGVILANEVVDAMPVHRFRLGEQQMEEGFVTQDGDGFASIWDVDESGDLSRELGELQLGLPKGYISEINLVADAWIHQLAKVLEEGVALLIDYGYRRGEYYHPERQGGTLLCHFRHRAHADALILPGLQDITAHVDFTALANAALAAGLQVAGYTTQGNFLINTGLDELLQPLSGEDSLHFVRQMQQVKTLTMPSQMGERFKVLALAASSQPHQLELRGFRRQDQRHRL